ncbi:MAG TPA: hypothetical protein VNU66_03765, partial [Mycobacteriales bacterium]|nr:hypothetical protein [Mycobacteriales bacterium]
DDHPRLGLGSAWNNVAWYGYASKELRRVLGRPVVAAPSRAYCGDLATCRASLRASFTAAVAREAAQQGTPDSSRWTYAKSQDNIRPTTAGVVGTREIDWQNRPTFQQVVAFTAARSEGGAAPVPRAPSVVAAPVRRLPATGLPAAALGGLVLLGVAAALRRRG